MLLNLFIKIHKHKLEDMIKRNRSYDQILAQSQKLDKYIAKKTLQRFNQMKRYYKE